MADRGTWEWATSLSNHSPASYCERVSSCVARTARHLARRTSYIPPRPGHHQRIPAMSMGDVPFGVQVMSTGVWRNGSASDSRSEGWEFESLCAHFAHTPYAVIVCHWVRTPSFDDNAAGEDRTHDLRIMRPTRCQLRYCRSEVSLAVCSD